MNILGHMTVFAAAPLLAAPVSAHHSDAGIDLESMVAIEGTVKEFAWRNPHIYLIVESVQSAEYRLRIVEEADRCTQPGALRSCPPETQARPKAVWINPPTEPKTLPYTHKIMDNGASMSLTGSGERI